MFRKRRELDTLVDENNPLMGDIPDRILPYILNMKVLAHRRGDSVSLAYAEAWERMLPARNARRAELFSDTAKHQHPPHARDPDANVELPQPTGEPPDVHGPAPEPPSESEGGGVSSWLTGWKNDPD